MKSFRCFHSLRALRLMAMLIALPLVICMPGILSNGRPASSGAETFKFPVKPPPQARTVVINIQDKAYVPPNRTPIIPPDLIDKGIRFAVRVGDTIKICNNDVLAMKPFSLSAGNSFEGLAGAGGLRPGQCMTYVVQAPGRDGNGDQTLKLFDELHARNKLWMVVLPKDSPDEGEQDTPDAPVSWDFNEEYAVTEGGDIIDPPYFPAQKRGRPQQPTDAVPVALDPRKGQPTPPDTPGQEPCTAADRAAFQKLIGTWKASNKRVTISGSCENATGTMVWLEYCETVDAPYNSNLRKYEGKFTGRMKLGALSIDYFMSGQQVHPDQKGTASCYLNGDGTLEFPVGCGGGGLKKQ